MKRYGRLWDKVLTYENIEEAARLSALGKKNKRNVRRFFNHYEENLEHVFDILQSGKFATAGYHEKTIYEPKKRVIYILPFFPDRIVQHAIMNVVEPIWDKIFDYHSYSCRKGKGIHTAMCYTNKLVNQFEYVAKNDISKFYPSMLHDKAMYFIEREITDFNTVEKDAGYRVIIEDISEDGAMIRVGGRGIVNSQIKLQFNIGEKIILMYGIVRAVEYNKAINQSLLHFECLHIEQEMKNAVLSFVYEIIPQEEKDIFDKIVEEAWREVTKV